MKGLLNVIPIIGKLGDVSRKSHWEAFIETLLTIFFAALPLILPPFAGFVIPGLNIGSYLNKIVDEGELLLYSAAFVGPLIYSILKYRAPSGKISNIPGINIGVNFPQGMPIIVVSIIICLVASLLFGLVRIAPLFAHPEISGEAMLKLSGFLYIISIICYYSTAAYRNDIDDLSAIPENFRSSTADFSKEWSNR